MVNLSEKMALSRATECMNGLVLPREVFVRHNAALHIARWNSICGCLLFRPLSGFSTQRRRPREINFIKNLGQWDSKVIYKVNLQGGHLFIENQTLTYVFHDAHNLHHIHELEHEKGNDFNALNHNID